MLRWYFVVQQPLFELPAHDATRAHTTFEACHGFGDLLLKYEDWHWVEEFYGIAGAFI